MPDPVVVGRHLVAGQGQSRIREADRQPRPDADGEHDRVARHVPLDRDQLVLALRGQVVVVRHPQVAVHGGRWRRHQVGAAALLRPLAVQLGDLLDRGGEHGPRVGAAALGDAVQLLDQPGPHLERRLPVGLGGGQCARPDPLHARCHRGAGRLTDLAADVAVRAVDPQHGDQLGLRHSAAGRSRARPGSHAARSAPSGRNRACGRCRSASSSPAPGPRRPARPP